MLVQKKTITRPNFISFNPPRFKTAKKQKTILKTINFSGKGLHSNNKVNMTISPAPPETGVVFRITHNKKTFEIKASFLNVSSTKLCTTISDEFVNSVSTIEHILSALYGMELDNIFIDCPL